jgi:hypothetical protein
VRPPKSRLHPRWRERAAERLLRNLARRLDQEAPGVAASILEGRDEMLTVVRLKLPTPLRRSLACTNAIENAPMQHHTSSVAPTSRGSCGP